MFIIKVIVGGGGVLECIILKGGFNILFSPFTSMIGPGLLYWITLDCTGVLNVVAGGCRRGVKCLVLNEINGESMVGQFLGQVRNVIKSYNWVFVCLWERN